MRCSEDQTKTISVSPGMAAIGDLASGPLRIERVRGAMTGAPVLRVDGDKITLRYADGAAVYINA